MCTDKVVKCIYNIYLKFHSYHNNKFYHICLYRAIFTKLNSIKLRNYVNVQTKHKNGKEKEKPMT